MEKPVSYYDWEQNFKKMSEKRKNEPKEHRMLVRMLLYNSWKINKAWLKKCRKKGKKRQKWTLQDNQDALVDLFLEA